MYPGTLRIDGSNGYHSIGGHTDQQNSRRHVGSRRLQQDNEPGEPNRHALFSSHTDQATHNG